MHEVKADVHSTLKVKADVSFATDYHNYNEIFWHCNQTFWSDLFPELIGVESYFYLGGISIHVCVGVSMLQSGVVVCSPWHTNLCWCERAAVWCSCVFVLAYMSVLV